MSKFIVSAYTMLLRADGSRVFASNVDENTQLIATDSSIITVGATQLECESVSLNVSKGNNVIVGADHDLSHIDYRRHPRRAVVRSAHELVESGRVLKIRYAKTVDYNHPQYKDVYLYGDPYETGLTSIRTVDRDYLYASRKERLLLLAGMVDGRGVVVRNSCRISTPYETYAEMVSCLAKSLGLYAFISDKTVGKYSYLTVNISGPIRIPTRSKAVPPSVYNTRFRQIRPEAAGIRLCVQLHIDDGRAPLLGDYSVI